MKVQIIARDGDAVLVEYEQDGKPRRVVVPKDVVHGTQVSKENLDASIEYGVGLNIVLEFPTAAQFIEKLNARGVWTNEDLLQNMATVRAILNEYVAINQARIRERAKKGV